MWKATILLAILFVIPHAAAYTVVTKGGQKFDAQAAPEIKNGKAVFRLKSGALVALPEGQVDPAATEKANQAPPPAPPAASKTPEAKKPEMPAGSGSGKNSFSDADLGSPRRYASDEEDPRSRNGYMPERIGGSAPEPEKRKSRTDEAAEDFKEKLEDIEEYRRKALEDHAVSSSEIEEYREKRDEVIEAHEDLREAVEDDEN